MEFSVCKMIICSSVCGTDRFAKGIFQIENQPESVEKRDLILLQQEGHDFDYKEPLN